MLLWNLAVLSAVELQDELGWRIATCSGKTRIRAPSDVERYLRSRVASVGDRWNVGWTAYQRTERSMWDIRLANGRHRAVLLCRGRQSEQSSAAGTNEGVDSNWWWEEICKITSSSFLSSLPYLIESYLLNFPKFIPDDVQNHLTASLTAVQRRNSRVAGATSAEKKINRNTKSFSFVSWEPF